MTFAKVFMIKGKIFMKDFQTSYKVLLFDKILFCYSALKSYKYQTFLVSSLYGNN